MARATIDEAQLRRVLRKFDRVEENVEIITREELMRSSFNIVALAKVLAPVITGQVRDSIRWEWDGEYATIIGSDLQVRGITGLLIVEELEHGTRTRPAKPFLWPAFKHEAPIFRATLDARIEAELQKVRRYL